MGILIWILFQLSKETSFSSGKSDCWYVPTHVLGLALNNRAFSWDPPHTHTQPKALSCELLSCMHFDREERENRAVNMDIKDQ